MPHRRRTIPTESDLRELHQAAGTKGHVKGMALIVRTRASQNETLRGYTIYTQSLRL